MNLAELQKEARQIAKSGSFADLQGQAAMALAWQDANIISASTLSSEGRKCKAMWRPADGS